MIKRKSTLKNVNLLENEIRPERLQSGMVNATKLDIRRINSKRKDFVTVNCPACGLNKYKFKFKKYNINFVDCDVCGTFFTNPRPTSSILHWFYKNSVSYNYWDKYVFPASEKIRRQKIFIPRVDLILNICSKFSINTKSILEVGAGHGTFCQEMMSRKVFEKVIAIEPVISQAKTCSEKGIQTINLPVEKIKFNKKDLFDVIVNFEVLEHLFSPTKFIKSCRKLLKKDGLLIFTTPNGNGFDVKLLGKLSSTVDHEHLNYFNPHSIELLLKKCGLQVVQIITPGKLDAELVRKKILSGGFNVPQESFLRNILIDNWDKYGSSFQSFISDFGLSSHMLVVARNIR